MCLDNKQRMNMSLLRSEKPLRLCAINMLLLTEQRSGLRVPTAYRSEDRSLRINFRGDPNWFHFADQLTCFSIRSRDRSEDAKE